MEAGLAFDALSIGAEGYALPCDDFIEVLECLEVPIDDRPVDMDPQSFGRLQFRRVGRQVKEPDSIGHCQVLLAVPAGIIQHQDDDALMAGASLLGEQGKQGLEQPLGNAGFE